MVGDSAKAKAAHLILLGIKSQMSAEDQAVVDGVLQSLRELIMEDVPTTEEGKKETNLRAIGTLLYICESTVKIAESEEKGGLDLDDFFGKMGRG